MEKLSNSTKDKIMNSPEFKNIIDDIVSKMSTEDVAKFSSKFNLSEGENGVPSFDDIFKMVNSKNPLNEELKQGSLSYKIVKLVKDVTGAWPLSTVVIPMVVGAVVSGGGSMATYGVAYLVTLVSTLIINGIANKLVKDKRYPTAKDFSGMQMRKVTPPWMETEKERLAIEKRLKDLKAADEAARKKKMIQ